MEIIKLVFSLLFLIETKAGKIYTVNEENDLFICICVHTPWSGQKVTAAVSSPLQHMSLGIKLCQAQWQGNLLIEPSHWPPTA